ncbi:caspase family protein [Microcoleus vaginatus DQ-U2]|uniref:nSTAND1 domain-containing NTPase n=1 Tax=Microcoleus vaginatus TaxID=119532 RepID=UPI0016834E90|nr:PD40 domain-containing protein [Microcoleus sp. FACHB-DQ6]
MSRDALVVGINTYQFDRLANLPAPSEDAEAIAQLLERYGDFKVTRLPAVKDKPNNTPCVGKKTEVTLSQLEEAIVQLFKPESRQIPDTALLYFSGHGLRKNRGIQEGFLATSDVNPDLGNWGLSLRWLRELLEKSPVRQQIIWLDCCYSGEILNVGEADPGYAGKARDRCFIAASRAYEQAFVKIGSNHSVLTADLLKGLEPLANRWVTNHSLADFLNRQRHAFPQHLICHNSGEAINFTRSDNPPITEKEPPPGICPYKGLAYFDCKKEDAEYFYGRTDLTDRLLDKVRSGNFLAVVGASGSGKSSVVRAGLLYQLKLGRRLSGSDRWRIHIFTPGERPFDNLAKAFIDLNLSQANRATELAKLQLLFKKNPLEGLGFLITATQAERIVLVVDQFEEAFTLCNNSELRQQFFVCLLNALERSDNKLCLVLTMRADFFGKCAEQEYAGLASKIQEHLVTVMPMAQKELEEAITKPAEQVKLKIAPGLAACMINDMDGAPGSLPLLQYTLTELWAKRHENTLTIAAYTKLGGVKGTLQKRATEVYESFSPNEQKMAKQIFLELTQLGEGTEDTRRRVLQKDLVTSQQSAALVNQVVKKLADANLVVTSTLLEKGAESSQIPVVDIAHESLIRHWSQLREWVNESRDAIRIERKIEQAAKDWEFYGKPRDLAFLLQGARLIEAENFLENDADAVIFSDVARELIEVSKVEGEARRNQILKEGKAARTKTNVAIFSTVLVSLVAWVAFNQGKQVQTLYENTILSKDIGAANGMSQLDRLIRHLKVGKKLPELIKSGKLEPDTQMEVLTALSQSVYDVKEQNRFIGHDNTVTDISFSPDGKTIASASNDKTVKLWSVSDRKLIANLSGHEEGVIDVSFSPDGQTIASASNDKTVKLWRASDRKLIATINSHSAEVNAVSFSPDGKTIASASNDKSVKLWSVSDRKLIATINSHSAEVNAVSFSPDGKTIASASSDKTVKLWSVSDRKLIANLTGHEDTVLAVSFSPDGQTIASASNDKTVKLWKLDGSLITTLSDHSNGVNGVSFSPDGQTIASASGDGTVKLWKRDGSLITTLSGHKNSLTDVSFSPDGQTIASASNDNTLKLWKYAQSLTTTLTGHSNFVKELSFSPDGQIMASASHDNTIKLWQRDGTPITTLTGHQAEVWTVSFSPDGQTIASASNDKTVKLWSVSDRKLITTLTGHTDQVYDVSFSSDGQMIASASRDGTVKLWQRDGKLIRTLKKQKDSVLGVSFSPDGQTIASANWDNTVKIWKVSDGNLIRTLKGHTNVVESITFSPDGQTIASASWDTNVKLWRVSDGELMSTLPGNASSVTNISFSADGQMIAYASNDNTVKLMKLDGRSIFYLTGHTNKVNAVSFSPDGNMLASASDDNTVILWNLNLDDMLKRSCDWARVYLKNPSNGMAADDPDRQICDDVQPSASFLVDLGINLAKKENIVGAVAKFQEAQQLDPSLNFDPQAKAEIFAASSLLAKGESLVREGKVKEAIAAYKQAQKLDPTLKIPANSWGNSLCWRGSLNGYAKDVMFACEKAVTLDPENGWIRDSRGVARALTGNNKGAIEDFEAFLKWADKNERYKDSKPRRQSWIDTLKAGNNPLTPEEMKKLLNQ